MATIRRGSTSTGSLVWGVPQLIQPISIVPPAQPVQPVPRVLSFGGYCFNGQHMQGLKSNCELTVIAGASTLFLYQGTTKIACYVAGNPDGSLPALEQAILNAKSLGLPIAAYWPRSLQSGPLPRGADFIAVEGYMQEATLQAWEKRVRDSLQRCPKAWLLAQCYTSNSSLTSNIEQLVAPYSRMLNDFPQVSACLLFSGAGRSTGLQDHPEVVPEWSVIANSVKTPPLTPVEPPVAIPNHKDIVVAARAKYASLPPGNERGYTITNQVAWDLRGEGAGTFFKPSGTNFNQRSIDVVIYKHRTEDPSGKGATFDVLGDAEGAATPQWTRTSQSGYGDVSNWRAPVDPGDEPEPPPPSSHEALLRDLKVELTEISGDADAIKVRAQLSIAKIDAALED